MAIDLFLFAHELIRLVESRVPFVTVTITAIRGSAPQIVGAKGIVTETGIVAGTVGGGKIESTAVARAQSLLREDSPTPCELVTWNLQTEIGMTCGGEVQLLFEVRRHDEWPIVVFGAGHVSQSLVPLLLTLSCRVTCIDSRADWLARLPNHHRLVKVCTDDLASQVNGQAKDAFFVLMSQGHASDLPVLTEILQTRTAPFVGVIGSAQKAAILKRNLQELGIDEPRLSSFRCPLGLPFGNNTPAEISISVAAQLLEQRDRWSPGAD